MSFYLPIKCCCFIVVLNVTLHGSITVRFPRENGPKTKHLCESFMLNFSSLCLFFKSLFLKSN